MMTQSTGEQRSIRVLGIGGSLRRPSESEVALRAALRGAEEMGAQTEIITAEGLQIPLFPLGTPDDTPAIAALLAAVRRADGIILASPAYHGTMSGALKNALDYLQLLAHDTPPYLDGRAVGVLSTGAGTQAAVQTINALRDVAHALRAWPTPIGVAIHESATMLAGEVVVDAHVAEMLRQMGRQVVEFARAWQGQRRDQGGTMEESSE